MKTRLHVGLKAAVLGALVLAAPRPALAALALAPELKGYTRQEQYLPSAQETLGRIELLSGAVKIYVPANKAVYDGVSGVPLASGDMVQTDQSSRCRLVFDNGDFLHVGPGSLVGVHRQASNNVVNLWVGRLIGYALPALEGRSHPLIIHVSEGSVELNAGKTAVSADGTTNELAVFDNAVRWIGKAGSQAIAAGVALRIRGSTFEPSPLPRDRETKLTNQISPEIPVVEKALAAFREGDLGGAQAYFSQIQDSFPYNGVASYYLGLIALKQGELSTTINQWQRYVTVDPEGAKNKDVPRHLTLMIAKQSEEEARYALANEARISVSPPEPRTIAVHLQNQGPKQDDVLGKGLTALVLRDLAKVPGVKIVDPRKTRAIMKQSGLSKASLTDQEAARAQKLLRAETVVLGKYALESGKE